MARYHYQTRRAAERKCLRRLLLGMLILLAGCGQSPQPIISDISDNSARVMFYADTAPADLIRIGNQACGQYGKTAAPVSWRCLEDTCMQREQLFVCR